jgi:hypothetical protein
MLSTDEGKLFKCNQCFLSVRGAANIVITSFIEGGIWNLLVACQISSRSAASGLLTVGLLMKV